MLSQRNIYTVNAPDALDATPQPLEPSIPEAPRASPALSLLEVLLCSGFPTQLIIGGLLIALGARVSSDDPIPFSFVVALSLLVLYRVERSRIGLTFHAIHWQDKLAESVGVQTFRYRTLAFVISAFFAGLSGALYAHYVGTVNPNRFSVEEMTYVLIWAIVGGTATFYGPILGVVVLTVLNEVVLRALGVDQMRPMLYGAILILFILFLPTGLESLVPKVKDWWAGRKQKPVRTAQPAAAERPASADLPAK